MKSSSRSVPAFGILLLLTGCATPLSNDSAKELIGRTLSVSTRAPYEFEGRTRGAEFAGSLFGVIGASIAAGTFAARGAQFAASNAISDPSNDLAMRIATEMRDKYKLTLATDRPAMTSRSDSGVASELSGRDLLLDIHPIAWGYSYYNRNPEKYGPNYQPVLRLVDVRKNKLITSSICIEGRELPADAPTHDELLADGGVRFKRMLQDVIELCADKFRTAMLLK